MADGPADGAGPVAGPHGAPVPGPGGCALGSSFALRDGGREGRGEVIIEEAVRCGASALWLWEGLPGERLADLLAALRRRRELPVQAVDGTLGAMLLGKPGLLRAALCGRDRDEGTAAAEGVMAALQLAQELSAPYVVVRLGAVAGVRGKWDGLRRRFLRGELMLDRDFAERLMAERNGAAGQHLGPCKRVLDGLLEAAERRGVTLLLKNPRRGIDMPSAVELEVLLQDLSGAPVAPLLDLPAAHLSSAMRLWALRDTVAAFSRGPLCCLGDACGAVGALVPGQGEVDVAAVARYLDPAVQRAFIPWSGLRLDEVTDGVKGVAELTRKLIRG